MFVNKWGDKVKSATENFVKTHSGKLFLSIVLLGPLTFLPTLWVVWTAKNIEAFRTPTWPLMFLVNSSGWLGAMHNGDWRIKIVMTLWTIIILGMNFAIIIR